MDVRSIRIGNVEIPYYFGNKCIEQIGTRLQELNADRFVVITDDNVSKLYCRSLLSALGDSSEVMVLSHAPGESMKSLDCLSKHIEQALAEGLSRRSVVVSLGGGVPGNLAGVLASLIFRGIRLVHIPTTTVSAMDSVLSLKQAINSNVGKNHLGCYYTPEAIMTDVQFFESLPGRELRSGLCEMAKNCLAIDPDAISGLWSVLENSELSNPDVLVWLLDASIKAKSEVMKGDAREQRSGLVLEYGHTVGHAIELVDHRRRGALGLSHGDSIAIGMLISARISAARGWLTREEVDIHDQLVGGLGVPVADLQTMQPEQIIDVVRDDNKRGYLHTEDDEVPFVLLESLGKPAWSGSVPLVPVSISEISNALTEINEDAVIRDIAKNVVAVS